MNSVSKYSAFVALFCAASVTDAQQTNTTNQAVVTIIGSPNGENTGNEFDLNSNTDNNPYETNAAPPQQQAYDNQTTMLIEPSLENGFHTRMQIASSQQSYEHSSTPSYSGEARKHKTSLSEHSFNLKKRLKAWLPKRKKKYRPHLCGRF